MYPDTDAYLFFSYACTSFARLYPPAAEPDTPHTTGDDEQYDE